MTSCTISVSGPLGCLNEARFGIVFGALGAARDCLHTALAYAETREQFSKPTAGFQVTQDTLAAMAMESGKGNVREALNIARTARTILGANGISAEYPVMWHANNLESVLTYEGTSEMHTLIIGQALTGHAAFA